MRKFLVGAALLFAAVSLPAQPAASDYANSVWTGVKDLYENCRAHGAKLAQGIADDALTCIALALNPQAKILIAPAMNGKMWLHPATQQNVATLKGRGVEFIGPEEGLLSCGYEGIGRLWPVDKVAERAMELGG